MTYNTKSPMDQSAGRSELANSLYGRGHRLGFEDLMDRLALSEPFNKYMASTTDMLVPAAQLVPALVNGQLQSFADGGQSVQATSVSLAKAFRGIWDSVRQASKTDYPVAAPASECRFSDQRSMRAGGVLVKPDGVFFYPKYSGCEFYSVHALLEARVESCQDAVSPDVLGRMADLALRAWEAQPTRLFVPFLYLHGPNVSLVLFARDGYYWADLGRVFHISSDPSMDDVCDIGDTLRHLWFLMTLPADRFGHVIDVSVPATGLKFTKDRSSIIAAGRSDGSALDYLQRIPLPVSLLDFQSYLFKTQYHGQPAMLKLVWTPTYRLPEVSMYDWLLSNGCNAVPKVLESSIVASDVFGYRLEYIVMEDCGVPLLEYFRAACGSSGDISKRDADAEDIFKQLASSLAIAESLGVAHCDISTENITVRDGTAFIIDWTRSQLNSLEVPPPLANVLREKWGLNAKDIQPQRWPMDNSVVQTKIYASIRSLWHDGTDCLVDRFESLFYVILHALLHSGHAPAAASSAFKILDRTTMALVKTGCMVDREMYPSHFGIADIGDGLKAFLDSIRVFLFCADGFFVGGKLVDSGFERSVRPDLARAFLSEAAYAATYADCEPLAGPSTAGVVAKPSFSFSSGSSIRQLHGTKEPGTPPGTSESATDVDAAAAVATTATSVPAASATDTKTPATTPVSAAPGVAATADLASAASPPTKHAKTTDADNQSRRIARPARLSSATAATDTASAAPTTTCPDNDELRRKFDCKGLAKAARDAFETSKAARDASTAAIGPATTAASAAPIVPSKPT
ncbi:hypothetical protein IWW39_002811 [Coemansia spiralis]|uniref:Protein kinase domain-containing protein n=1 Tax=Coemansia spiralis TaxID=417178 RepID=A0A9W8GJT1_9FUNG|nr:hypothetical protein IWW39_002811 [Coemansia spiralis]